MLTQLTSDVWVLFFVWKKVTSNKKNGETISQHVFLVNWLRSPQGMVRVL